MMGKRRKPTQVARRATWDVEDELALLGLLDYCIKHNRVFPFTEENVVGRLCSVGSSREYNWDQINRKLIKLWDNIGSNDSLNKTDIYAEGSACLVGLTEDEMRTVELKVEQLENSLKPVCL